jgi:hypothetical protein
LSTYPTKKEKSLPIYKPCNCTCIPPSVQQAINQENGKGFLQEETNQNFFVKEELRCTFLPSKIRKAVATVLLTI